MDSSIVTDSLQNAWARTRTLLLERIDVGVWLKLGFIAMLGAAGGGGGGGGAVQIPGGPSGDGGEWEGAEQLGTEALQSLWRAGAWLSSNIESLLVLAVGLAIIWVVLFVGFVFVKAVFRFIFVDAVAAPVEPRIGPSWRRHTGHGLSLVLWYLLVGLVPLVLLAAAIVPLVLSGTLAAGGERLPAVLGLSGIAGLGALALVAAAGFALVRSLTEDFLVPAMYVRRCGVWEGWGHVGRAWRGQFVNVVLYYVLKVVCAIGAGLVAGFVGLASLLILVLPAATLAGMVAAVRWWGIDGATAVMSLGGPALLAIVLGGAVYGYLLNCLLLPINVFFQAYSLSFIGRLDPALRTI
ncbi:MAG: DUF7544 domain-containing protein [Armatimonadota bacterium]